MAQLLIQLLIAILEAVMPLLTPRAQASLRTLLNQLYALQEPEILMAVPSYTEDLTDITLAETTTGWSAYGGGGAGLGVGADFAMQGTLCVDKQITAADKGHMFDNGTAITLGAGDHVFVWHFCATPGVTDTIALKGASILVGSTTTAYTQYHVEGIDTYGAEGRVARCYPINYAVRTASAVAPYRTVTGAPGANPQTFGGGLTTTASVKSANLGIDAIRYGTGAYLTAGELISAGDGTDNPCTFAGFAVQNDAVANRWGIFGAVGGSYELQGRFVAGQNNAGTATLCRFEDSDKNIVLVNTIHTATDFTQFIIDHASTVCNWTNIGITALGTNNPGRIIVNVADPTFNVTGGSWTALGISTLRSNTTLTGLTIRRCGVLTQNGATLASCLVDASATMLSNTPNLISDCTFTAAATAVNAIEITTPGTYTFSGNLFSGYSGTGTSAAIYNNSGGAVTLNISGGGDTPTIRNGAGATTTVVNAVVLNITAKDAADASNIVGARVYLEAAAGGPATAGDVILTGVTNGSGLVTDGGFAFLGNQPVVGRIRKSSAPIFYKTAPLSGTITANGLELTGFLVRDQ